MQKAWTVHIVVVFSHTPVVHGLDGRQDTMQVVTFLMERVGVGKKTIANVNGRETMVVRMCECLLSTILPRRGLARNPPHPSQLLLLVMAGKANSGRRTFE